MAGLKKPDRCPCGSIDLQRQYGPERWVCVVCAVVVRSRQPKPDQNSCRDCGAARGSKPFKAKKNQCVECSRKQYNEWKRDNADHLKAYRSQPDFKRKRRLAVKKAIQRSPEAFIKHLLCHMSKMSAYKKRNDGRAGKMYKGGGRGLLEITIDLEYLVALWYSQDGRCALSGMPMVHRFNSFYSISIDRKDSSLGYIPGNVQLVCQWVNRAKNKHSDAEMKEVFKSFCSRQWFMNDEWTHKDTGRSVREYCEPAAMFLKIIHDRVVEKFWSYPIRMHGDWWVLVVQVLGVGQPFLRLAYDHDDAIVWCENHNEKGGSEAFHLADPGSLDRLVAFVDAFVLERSRAVRQVEASV